MRLRTSHPRARLALRDERGMALIMALGIMFVLTISLGTIIYVTSAAARHANHSNAGQKAYALAEAGVNDAMAVLNANYPDKTNHFPGNRCLLRPQVAPAGFPGTSPWGGSPSPEDYTTCGSLTPITVAPDAGRPTETVTWWGRLRRVNGMIAWVIRSTGSVPNPTGPGAAPVTRMIQTKVPVKIADPELPSPGVLEWLYSPTDATALQSVKINSPFYTRGNLTLGNGVEAHAPLYVTCVKPPVPVPTTTTPCPSTAGNVLMENTGQVFQGATVAIGGRLTQTSPQNTVGTNANRISEAHIVNGCETSTRAYSASCLWDLHDVFVTGGSGDRIMPPDPVPNPPVIDWPFWYQFGSPGPMWGCDSGTTPMLESPGNTLLDNSVPTVFNLTPATNYSCKTQVGDEVIGELSWDAPSKTLTVHGTVYVDGSLRVEKSWGGQDAARYQGKGTIYMSGSFELKNTAVCAARDDNTAGDGSRCNLSAWDPKVNALVIVAKSKGTDAGAQAAAGNNSVEVKSSEFQGVLSGEYDVLSETTSVVQGPIISFQGGLHVSQTSGASFPDITFPPAGAPGNPPPPSQLLEPREFEGG